MVFFTCNACGESLKKAQVEKHVNMCRGCQVLSCIDCGKDFWGDDYKNHLKCISEDQKYGGKGYEGKANKGDVKQQQWIQRVHDAMNNPGVSAKLKGVLQQVSSYDNVPRKKAKFQNWMRNSLKIANTSLHDEVWDILSAADNSPETPKETKEAKQTVAEVKADTNGNEKQNGHQDGEEEKKKKLNKRERKEARQQKNGKAVKGADKTVAQEPEEGKKKKKDRKRKHSSEEDGDEEQNGAADETSSKKSKTVDEEAADTSEETEDQEVPKGKFNWKGNIKAVLRESDDQELPVKKLRKKILAAYYSFTGDRNFKKEEDVLALFNKKINNNPKFRVLKDRVRLVK
ncbi:cell growth-regulating nucleolar protein [Anoplopoma fimbria]|uniref:cell growth-regulating nucleolar protein n=1 Tax=Anoplopoma fimbria TaxID=229290 RepID=UPI0023EC2CF0|nr:cell growth-regulating nucleolar protein [Anoplopoma fimbria]